MNKPKTTVTLCSSIGQIPVQFLLSEAGAFFLCCSMSLQLTSVSVDCFTTEDAMEHSEFRFIFNFSMIETAEAILLRCHLCQSISK